MYLDTETAVGQTVKSTIFRDGVEQTVDVTLDERPPIGATDKVIP